MLVLKSILRNMVRVGTLTVIDAKGIPHVFAGERGPAVTIRLHDHRMPWGLALMPSLAAGEGYMDGRLTVDDGTIYDFLALMSQNMEVGGLNRIQSIWEITGRLFKRFQQFNPAGRAKKNVSHHYDLSSDLYELFLDRDKQYSCAYFVSPETDLETAQEHKKRHLAAKLLISPGQRILDIGSGWGGMVLYLARKTGAFITGVTLSEEQLQVSQERAEKEGLADQVAFHLRDYRAQTGTFDRIVSVGMFEHVGVGFYPHYFGKMKELLADNGIAVLHTIGRSGPPGVTDPWIRKYIFPGGYIPSLSEVTPVIERSGLVITDIEFIGPHYARTLRAWRKRFRANWNKVREIYDERFCRMWEFYLASSEIAFRHLGLTVFQIQMTNRHTEIPPTRDYIAKLENEIDEIKDGQNRAA